MSAASEPKANIETTVQNAVDLNAVEWEATELETIVNAIANSQILVPAVEPKFVLSDWERVRHSPDVDGFILAWIASHVRSRHPNTLS
jgi:hypothetical protein